MRSFIAILPFMGLALAQEQCGPRSTVTETQVERIYVTVPAMSNAPTDVQEAKKTSRTRPTRPHFTHYPFGNGTFTNSTRFPTNTPVRPTTFQTRSSALPTFTLPSSQVPSESSSSKIKSTKTGTSTAAPTSAASTEVPSSASSATSATPSTSPVQQSSSGGAAVKGKATFYTGNIDTGSCLFTGYTLPAGVVGTAFGGNWDASQCGACVSVTGPNGNTIKAMVVDQCPECDVTHLDLFENGFTQLGAKSTGVLDISYTQVPCDISSPLVLKNKDGTSEFHFAMQVVNSNVAVSKLEFSTDGGASWKPTKRATYNFFEEPKGSLKNTVDIRVTSAGGETIVVKDVSVASSTSKTADSNFSA